MNDLSQAAVPAEVPALDAKAQQRQNMKDQYDALCSKRDGLLDQIKPIQNQIEGHNTIIWELREKTAALAEQRSQVLGGQSWLDLNKQIGQLAAGLKQFV